MVLKVVSDGFAKQIWIGGLGAWSELYPFFLTLQLSTLYAMNNDHFYAVEYLISEIRVELVKQKSKGMFLYSVQYPVRWTAQSASHFAPLPTGIPVHSNTNSAPRVAF